MSLTVAGINTKAGNIIRIAVYDKEEFLEESKEQKSVKSTEDTTYVELINIPNGKFAIAVFQDINLDGFSNNKRGTFGPPDFEDVSFDVIEDKSTTLKIYLE
jgi:uncharacterized protein (DUF2141 family)